MSIARITSTWMVALRILITIAVILRVEVSTLQRSRSSREAQKVDYITDDTTPILDTAAILELRRLASRAFFHSFDSYMNHGYPYDEILPISCSPRRFDNRTRGSLDDVLGDFYLTLVDSLDTLILIGEPQRFKKALHNIRNLSFRKDVDVSVFETNIRILGALLSAHQLASKLYSHDIYDGKTLLNHAIDLGNRLLPAFQTKTGIPFHRINLLHGKIKNEQTFTCTAAGTSFLLEMSLLSRLSGKASYEKAAYKALVAIWNRRSPINLVGSTIDVHTGRWLHEHTGIGAGIDSFYETILKSGIFMGDQYLLAIFDDAYQAIQLHSLVNGWNVEINMHRGKLQPYSYVISSLSAFWPALQVLAGDVSSAVNQFAAFEVIWNKHGALPDMFNFQTGSLFEYGQDYPLRPEMVESAYHLYMATRDQQYVDFGRRVILMLEKRCRTTCGYASIANVVNGRLDDRMDSYFLAETLKYLYLLFDYALPQELQKTVFCHGNSSGNSTQGLYVNKVPCISMQSSVFSTEGHLFLIDYHLPKTPPLDKPLKSNLRRGSTPTVPKRSVEASPRQCSLISTI